ncbi:MAG: sigma-70 family RNA polymerase sigma factor [Planctomycetales bacterium]|nr:sigma-70 family RNA polymerase sigma factor [Planctomycetales bacterium]
MMPENPTPADSNQPITDLLKRIVEGDAEAREELFRQVYSNLHAVAQSCFRNQGRSQTLNPTDLVNEVAVKMLSNPALLSSNSRGAFYSLVSITMRHVLIDHARKRSTQKRKPNGDRDYSPIDQIVDNLESTNHLDLIALNEALDELKSRSERQHEIVIRHFFGGLSFPQVAGQLGVCLSTVEKDWSFARCWLLARMQDQDDEQR